MGLRDTFKNAAQTALSAAGDVVENAHLYQEGSSVHNVSSGTVSTIDSRYLLSAIFSKYKAYEIVGSHIQPHDLKATLAQKGFSPIPTVNDYVVRIEDNCSTRYDVVDVKQDAAGATWNLQIRKA